MALHCLFTVAGKFAEYAIQPVGRQFGYLIYYNSNIHALRTQVHKLEMDKVMVLELVDAATRNGEHVLPSVQEWLNRSDLIIEMSTEFLNDQVNENQKCFSPELLCPDLVSRYRVSRKSSKKKLEVDALLDEGKFERVSIPAPPPQASSVFSGKPEAFESRKSTFKAIMDALKDDEVKMIGVYGMGGIGKTSMVEQVAMEADQSKLIDEFAIAVVSQIQDVPKIQRDIAELLGLKLDVKSKEARAGKLFERINQGKKILLILDDLWSPVDLTAIGIPRGGKYCKIVLTSRDRDVCEGMNCDRLFPINVLSNEDAWSFFRSRAGAEVDSLDLNPIATEIVAKCAGLPIAILTIAQALRDKDQHFWTDALHQLRNSTPNNIKGMSENVYSLLEVSYRFLEWNEQYCFLVCCLFKEDDDISMECLVRYGLGLNLFEGAHTVEAARDRAHVLVGYLKARSLLMDGKDSDSVTMHDVIRDFAHFLTSNGGEHVFLVIDGAEIAEWSDSNTYNRCTAISLLSRQIFELPEVLDCPKLRILIFEHDYTSTNLKIPSNIFQEMKELRVLKMCHYSIPSIPPSISILMNLETLFLEDCTLKDFFQIGGLKKLKVLSLARSMFGELPREIGLLKQLMILDLTECEGLKVVPPNLISSLTRLECLYLLNSLEQWSWGGSNANACELNHLPRLTTLEMHVSDISLLPENFQLFQKLKKFRVCIGEFERLVSGLRRDLDKVIVVQVEPDYNNSLPDGVRTLIERSQVLLVKFKGYGPHQSSVTLNDLNEGGLTTLKYLEVKHNHSMKYLVDSSSSSRVSFLLLEYLELKKLGLSQICNGDLPDGSFGELRKLSLTDLPNLTNLWYTHESARYPCLVNLQDVSISGCNNLKHAFPQSASGVLGQLCTLDFRDCNSLEGLFLEDKLHMSSDIILLPKLQKLSINGVPSLKSFCVQDNEACAAGQQSRTKILFPALECLNLEHVDQDINIWLEQLLPESFLSLRELMLHNCKSIVSAIPSNVPRCLQNLAILIILDCESLETVLVADAIPQSQMESPREFPSLTTIYIQKCSKLKTFAGAFSSVMRDSNSNVNNANLIPPFFDEKITFPALENLTLIGIGIPKEIWHRHLPLDKSTCSIREVQIAECSNLVTIFPPNLLPGLQNLSKIVITSCYLLERVFDVDNHTKFTLPSVQAVYLYDLNAHLIHSFLSAQVYMPVLQQLTIESSQDLEELWPDQLQDGFFNQPKVLTVDMCNKLSKVINLRLLLSMKNLDKISVARCELVKEIVNSDCLNIGDQDLVNDAMLTRSNLRELELTDLPNLVELWWNKDCSGVFSCPKLHSLEVSRCPGLRNIFIASAIKHDMNVKTLTISNCLNMEEVVREEKDGEYSRDKLVFQLVQYLSLRDLPNLKRFCGSNCILELPSLSKMVMNNCPNMETFCMGPIITPQLKGLPQNEDDEELLWEGRDLNTTIQHLFNIQRETGAGKKEEEIASTQQTRFGATEKKLKHKK